MDRSPGRGFSTIDELLCIVEEDEMSENIKLLDVVALTDELPARKLRRGQVGTVVELLGQDVFEVEFADNDGRTYASLALKEDQLLVLHYKPKEAA